MAQSYIVDLFEVNHKGKVTFTLRHESIPLELGSAAGSSEGLNYSFGNNDGKLEVRIKDMRNGFEFENTLIDSAFLELNEDGLRLLVEKVEEPEIGQAVTPSKTIRYNLQNGVARGSQRNRAGGVAGGAQSYGRPTGAGGVAGGVKEQTFEEIENKH